MGYDAVSNGITPLKLRTELGHDQRRHQTFCPLLPPIHELIGLVLELLIPRGNDLLASSRINNSVDIFYDISAVILQYKGENYHMRNIHYSTIERRLYYHIKGLFVHKESVDGKDL